MKLEGDLGYCCEHEKFVSGVVRNAKPRVRSKLGPKLKNSSLVHP